MSELLYPIGLQSFSEIREKGFVYIDKTAYLEQLIKRSKYVFLSRPRRFGKSLLLSTIEAFFLGRTDLFQGLAISRFNHDWDRHPILHIDLVGADYNTTMGLKTRFDSMFRRWEAMYGVEPHDINEFGVRFGEIIQAAHHTTGKQVVILVDEYDKPLLETVDNEILQESHRNMLRSIYGNLKSQDEHIRFAMLTGVTRFGHLSIFSDLNNLHDISMDDRYAGLCGITSGELKEYFDSGITAFAEKDGITVEEAYSALKMNYDGYHFSPRNMVDVYNPFSVLNALENCWLSDYWFRSGTPTFLVKLIREGKLSLRRLGNLQTSIRALSDVSFNLSNYISVLYQAGYLTIKSYDRTTELITLDFPNLEVERGFFECLLDIYTPIASEDSAFAIQQFLIDINNGNPESFMRRLQSFFSDFPYNAFDLNNLEQHYQDVVYIVMKLMGLYTKVEYMTASGRIDLLVAAHEYLYVFEFKIDKSPAEALAQIDSCDYMLPFKADGRKLVKIGANFSTSRRTLDDWIVETSDPQILR